MRTTLALVLLLGTLPARSAAASEDFPDVLKNDLGLPKAPDCAVCHQGAVHNYDSVRTPMGLALRARGVGAEDGSALIRALGLLADEGVDSDRDGVGDIIELQMGTDPNVAEGHNDRPIHFGCGLAPISGVANTSEWMLAGLLSIAIVARRRIAADD